MKKTNKKEMEKDLKTYEEWAKELKEKEGIEILDPDGFRNDPQKYYTKEEFNKRLMVCTIQRFKTEKDLQEKVLNVKDLEVNVEVAEEDLKETETKTNELAEIFRAKVRKAPVIPEKVFTNIKKLKCDYTVYKKERTNCKMPVQKECAKCGKKFKEGDELYIANSNGKDCIICSKCANRGE